MSGSRGSTTPLKFERLDYTIHRPYRWRLLDYVLYITWRPFLWLLNRRIWRVTMGRFSDEMYRALDMPSAPAAEYLELGTFRPADSLDLIKIATNQRIADVKKMIGRNYVTSPISLESLRAELFHTWEDFSSQQKQYDTPTRAEEVDFGRSLHGYEINREGYLKYLRERPAQGTRDLYRFLMTPLAARIPVEVFRRHAWILGMIGAGKSELIKILVSELHKHPRSTVITFDPERKLGEEIAWSKDYAQGDSLIYIDPALGRSQQLFPIFNPFEFPNTSLDEQATYTEGLVTVIAEVMKGDVTERMRTLLSNCIRVLLRRAGSTLEDLERFMDGKRNADLIELGAQHPDRIVRGFFEHSFHNADWKRTKDPLAARLQTLLSRPAFANCILGQSSIHIERLVTSKKTIVLVLDEGELGEMGSRLLGAFFVAMLENTIRRMRSGSREQSNPDPVYIVPDEFQRFVTPRFGEILTRARRLGLHLIGANQYMGQDGLSDELSKNMKINTAVKMVGLFLDNTEAERAAKLVEVSADDLKKLGNGRYAIKADRKPSMVVQVRSDRLGHSNSMTAAEWNAIEQHQLKTYYRSPMSFEPPTPSPTPETPTEGTNSPTKPPAPQQTKRRSLRPKFGQS